MIITNRTGQVNKAGVNVTYELWIHKIKEGTKKLIARQYFPGNTREERQELINFFVSNHDILSRYADSNHSYPRTKDYWTAEGLGY